MKTRMLASTAMAAALVLGCRGPKETSTTAGIRGQTTLTNAEVPAAVPPPAAANTPDVAGLVGRVSPSVVNITATQELRLPHGEGPEDPFESFFGPPTGRRSERDGIVKRRGLGSGFILDHAGHVVTNAHVVENATTLRVTLSDGREFDAKVKGRDRRLDLAILELRGARDLPQAPLGASEPLRVGEYVVAIGNPFGLGNTVTMGIVSAKGRALGAGPYDDFIQTDASINPGNSGGPLFDVRGQVVGISTAIAATGQGIGFAIPVDALKDVLPQLMEKGSVSRGRLGVAIQTVDAQLAKALGLEKPMGALITDVEPGGAADKAGLEPGDVVTNVDQAPVVQAHDLPRLVARKMPGTRVPLDVLSHNGARHKVVATLDELQDRGSEPATRTPAPAPPGGRTDFGLELGDDRTGIVVRGIEPGSAAGDALEPGDVIVEVNGAPVSNAREAAARMRDTRKERPLLLKVLHGGRTLYVAIERD